MPQPGRLSSTSMAVGAWQCHGVGGRARQQRRSSAVIVVIPRPEPRPQAHPELGLNTTLHYIRKPVNVRKHELLQSFREQMLLGACGDGGYGLVNLVTCECKGPPAEYLAAPPVPPSMTAAASTASTATPAATATTTMPAGGSSTVATTSKYQQKKAKKKKDKKK